MLIVVRNFYIGSILLLQSVKHKVLATPGTHYTAVPRWLSRRPSHCLGDGKVFTRSSVFARARPGALAARKLHLESHRVVLLRRLVHSCHRLVAQHFLTKLDVQMPFWTFVISRKYLSWLILRVDANVIVAATRQLSHWYYCISILLPRTRWFTLLKGLASLGILLRSVLRQR